LTKRKKIQYFDLRVLDPFEDSSYTNPRTGDIFTFRIRGVYRFGRVIQTKISPKLLTGALVYLYNAEAELPVAPTVLLKEKLLFPPELLWSICWESSVFKFVENRPLEPTDIFPLHCFHRYPDTYVDEFGNPLPSKIEPCSGFGLTQPRGLDYRLALKLGIISTSEEYNALPKTIASNYVEHKNTIEILISIPAEELNSAQVDPLQIEEALMRAKPRIGEWVESGTSETHSLLFFDVPKRSVAKASEVIQSQLKHLGVRQYNIRNASSGEEIV
jgi:hypothetical protein